jgi:hypothetical protein
MQARSQVIEWAKRAGFADPKQFDLKPHHYGIVMSKKGKCKVVVKLVQ